MLLSRGIGWSLALFVLGISVTYAAPQIRFNPQAQPLPDTPFPNNFFTVQEPTSVTGLRVQLPIQFKSQFEKRVREHMNQLNGFGVFSPITVSFDEPIDPNSLNEGSIVVIQLQKNSSAYGTLIPIDFRSGLFEYQLEEPTSYFPNDPQSHFSNYLFPNGNSDPMYEPTTHTTIFRPLNPLEEETRYAVMLTNQIRGTDGEQIQTHLITSPDLMAELKSIEVFTDSVVYAWEFTTQSIRRPYQTIREGLYGQGAFAKLAQEFPPTLREITDLKTWPFDIDFNSYTLTPTALQNILKLLVRMAKRVHLMPNFPFEDLIDWSSVDYFVFGNYFSPQFQQDENETGMYRPEPVYFMAAIPKKTDQFKPPFPLAIFGHGNKRARVDAIGLANKLAQGGIATITIDAAGHGPDHFLASIPVFLKRYLTFPWAKSDPEYESVKKDLKELGDWMGVEVQDKDLATESFIGKIIDKIFRRGIMRVLTREGRADDVDEDGIADSGENFFTADFFKTRNIMRQTIVDFFQLVRVIKNLGTDTNGNQKIDLTEGDFNGDGISDIGGKNVPIYYIGQSMGGMLGSLLMATEPEIKTGIINVGGGGLTDILLRTSSKFNAKRVYHQLLGPTFCAFNGNGKTYLTINSGRTEDAYATIGPLDPGGEVFLRNKTKNTAFTTTINDQKGFMTSLPSDRGDQMELDIFNHSGILDAHINYAITYQEGLGYIRNTPEFMNFVFMAQWVIDPSDPINFAPHWKDKNVLIQLAAGDWTVPILSGINLGRVAGLLSTQRIQWLLGHAIHRGNILPIDIPENPPAQAYGTSIRFHPSGKHEYLVIPDMNHPDRMPYTSLSQNQVIRYFQSNGAQIDE